MDGEAGWWTTSGNIGLPPLVRAMGVGRQQQLGISNLRLLLLVSVGTLGTPLCHQKIPSITFKDMAYMQKDYGNLHTQ